MKRQLLTLIIFVSVKLVYSQENKHSDIDSLKISELDFKEWSYIGKMNSYPVDSILKIRPIEYLRYLGTFKYTFNDSAIRKHVSMKMKKTMYLQT
jgi:hypothetical protein